MIRTTDTQKEIGFIHTKHNGDMVNVDRIMTKKDGQMVQVFEQGFTREQETAVLPLTTISNTIGKNLKQYEIFGNSEQDGIPSPDNPVEIESVGDKTDDTPHRYKIPITVTNGTNIFTTNIYLIEPLRKIGNYADYIDFKNKKVVRKIKDVDLGTLSYTHETLGKREVFCHSFSDILPQISASHNLLALSELYRAVSNNATWVNGDMAYRNLYVGEILIAFVNNNYTTVDDFIENMKGVHINYVLQNPIEEHISLPQISTVKNGKSTFNILTETQPSDFKIIYKGASTR